MRLLHVKSSKKKCNKERSAAILLSIFIATLLSGCGLSDGSYHLTGEYYISHINAHCICLETSSDPENGSYKTHIPNFFIVKFCNNDQYIGLWGVITEKIFASDLEKEQGERVYYLVATNDGSIFGPFEEESAYLAQCELLGVGEMGEWLRPRDVHFE